MLKNTIIYCVPNVVLFFCEFKYYIVFHVLILLLFVQVKTNAEVEREQIVRVVRRQMEAEKELAISETKKKKWVRKMN